MTVRVTTLKGPDAGAYYVEHLPRYYLAEGEPQGRWQGLGAGSLSLGGHVADDPFMALMAGLDPRDPERSLGNPYDERSVRGFDVTASAPKSVSLLFALGSSTIRQHAVAAHDAAVAAMVDWIEQHAHTRYRIGGQVAVVDAQGIIAAEFRQHTSRALDPQLHTHVVIPNRVKSPDGRWLALDARTIKRDQRTLSALYHAAVRAELTARLGVRWHDPVNGIAEIADMPEELLGAFSALRGRDDAARYEKQVLEASPQGAIWTPTREGPGREVEVPTSVLGPLLDGVGEVLVELAPTVLAGQSLSCSRRMWPAMRIRRSAHQRRAADAVGALRALVADMPRSQSVPEVEGVDVEGLPAAPTRLAS